MMSAAFSTEEEKDKNREAKGLATKKESTKQTEVKIRPHNVICFSAFLTRSILLAPKRYPRTGCVPEEIPRRGPVTKEKNA